MWPGRVTREKSEENGNLQTKKNNRFNNSDNFCHQPIHLISPNPCRGYLLFLM